MEMMIIIEVLILIGTLISVVMHVIVQAQLRDVMAELQRQDHEIHDHRHEMDRVRHRHRMVDESNGN